MRRIEHRRTGVQNGVTSEQRRTKLPIASAWHQRHGHTHRTTVGVLSLEHAAPALRQLSGDGESERFLQLLAECAVHCAMIVSAQLNRRFNARETASRHSQAQDRENSGQQWRNHFDGSGGTVLQKAQFAPL
jgi:hypothetical protein